MCPRTLAKSAILLALIFGMSIPVYAQTTIIHHRPFAETIIIPQSRVIPIPPIPPIRPPATIQITGVEATVDIEDQASTTTLDISLSNPGPSRLEAEVVMPVPDGSVVKSLAFQGPGGEATFEILPKEEARRIYQSIVNQTRDPALMEFLGLNLVRSSVFPVDGHGTQKVRMTYEYLLPSEGKRVDYVLPRSESVAYTVPWTIKVQVHTKRPLSTVYSPSHEIKTEHEGERTVIVTLKESSRTSPGPFRLSYLLGGEDITASLFAYPDPKVGGGYFLLLAGVPAKSARSDDAPSIKREVTLVFDRSGSMRDGKVDQVREAALQIIAGLMEGEAFNIIAYNEAIDTFSNKPVIKTRETQSDAGNYLKGIQPRGGTNINDALIEALRQKPIDGMLPIVLFLTDGIPTVGELSEKKIREAVLKGNTYNKRLFTFGVGFDVNTPLLEKIAVETRATASFVLPGEDVEVKVAQVFNRLQGPVLAEPEIEVVKLSGDNSPGRVRDMIPSRIPDIFEDDQLVLLGQYVDERPLSFKLSGNYLGKSRTFKFDFDLDNATTKNSFVPRLWASRKIAVLIDGIRDMGAEEGQTPNDPKFKELVDEIVILSKEFGILTEYTAFLAREGSVLDESEAKQVARASGYFNQRAMEVRSGAGSVNQSMNLGAMRGLKAADSINRFQDENLQSVQITTVQQMNDLAFYKDGNRWVDSRALGKDGQVQARREVHQGTREYEEIANRMERENRAGSLALPGEVLLMVNDEAVLIHNQ